MIRVLIILFASVYSSKPGPASDGGGPSLPN